MTTTTVPLNLTAEFGNEGSLPYRSLRLINDISASDLAYYLEYTIKAIDIKSPIRRELLGNISPQFVQDILGQETYFNIQRKLDSLRQDVNPSIRAKTMQRTLGLLSVDMIDAFSMKTVNPLVLYNDLHIPCPELLPEVRKAGAVGFVSTKLYQDRERRIRFHMFLDDQLKTKFTDLQDIVHEHFGDSASLILAGLVHNQHFTVKETNAPASNYMYRVVPDFLAHTNPEKAMRSRKSINKIGPVTLTQISNRYYAAGSYYQMAGVYDPNSGYPYIETDKMTFHRGMSHGITATLFTQKYPEGERAKIRDRSILPDGRPDVIVEDYETREVPKEEGLALIHIFDAQIRKKLQDIDTVSTMLDRDPSKIPDYEERKQTFGTNLVYPPQTLAA